MASVLLAVSVTSPLGAQDQHISDVLTTAGHTVTAALSTVALPNSGYDVCVVTESGAAASAANTSIAACALPVVHMETNWSTTNMATSSAASSTSSAVLDLIDTAHPIVAGFSDPVTIRSSNQTFYGVPSANLAAGVVNVAESGAAAGTCVVAAADTGATLTSGTAPNRRVEFGPGIGGSGATSWNTSGDQMFLQAVEWAANLPTDPGVGYTLQETGDRIALEDGSGFLLNDTAETSGGTTYPAAGTVAAVSATTGTATADLQAAGTTAAVSTCSGSAVARLLAGGTVAIISTATGSATSRLPASGSVAVTSAATGSAVAVLPAGGTTAAVSTTTGSATVTTGATTYPAAGTVTVLSASTGAATARLLTDGVTAAGSTTSGSAVARYLAAGVTSAVSATTGAVTAFLTAAGTTIAQSGTYGAATLVAAQIDTSQLVDDPILTLTTATPALTLDDLGHLTLSGTSPTLALDEPTLLALDEATPVLTLTGEA